MNRIKELREAAGIQQKELAIALKVSQPTVSDWESGRKLPSARSTMKLAEYFVVSVEYLLGGEVTKDSKSISDDDIKFALFGDVSNITDAQFEEVKRFAQYIKGRGVIDK